MKKYIQKLPILLLFTVFLFSHPVFAGIKVGDFDFSDTIPYNSKTVFVDVISNASISNPMSTGKYDLAARVGFYGKKVDVNSDFDLLTDKVVLKYRSGISNYISDLGLSDATTSDVGDYRLTTVTAFSSDGDIGSTYVDPGIYSVDVFLDNNIITTTDVCLPSFDPDGPTGPIGNRTCSSNNQNPTQNTDQGTNTNTPSTPQQNPVNLSTCNLFSGAVTSTRESTPDSGFSVGDRVRGTKDIPVGSNDQTRLFTYGLEFTPRHTVSTARDTAFDTHVVLVRNEQVAKIDRKEAPYNFEIGFSTVNNSANFKWFPVGQGTMGTKDSDSLISYSVRLSGLKPGTKYWYTVRDKQYNTVLSTESFTTTGTYVAPVNVQQSDCYIGTAATQQNSNNNPTQNTQNTNQNTNNAPGNNTGNANNPNLDPAGNANIIDPEIASTLGSGLTPCTDAKSVDCYQLLEPLPQKQEDGTYKYINNFNIGTEGKDDKGIAGFINFMFEIGIGIAGVLGVVMLTIYGFQYASNDKNINTFAELKTKITNVIFGILLLLGIFIILRTINPDLLIVEPDIAKQLLQLEKTAVKDSYGNPVLTGGGEEYDPTGKNDVQRINKNISEYDSIFKKYASEYSVSCNLLKATMYRESGGNPNLTSSRGAQGLMQFMPGTAAEYGFSSADMFIPEKAIHAGAKFYKNLFSNGCNLQKSNSVCTTSNIKYVVAAYNAGPGSNRPSSRCDNQTAWECVLAPDFKETRKYVPIVLNNALELKSRGWGCE